MSTKKLASIEISNLEITKTVLLNITKMLINRGIFDNKNEEKIYKQLESQISSEMVFSIKSDITKKEYHFKFINQKLTTIRKVYGIEEFFLKSKNNYRFIITSNLNKKAYKQLIKYKDTEVFRIHELLINIMDHDLIPKHIVLNEDEKKKYLEAYETNKKTMSKMNVTDPVARYYNMQVGDIVRIERPSITSGISIHYRIVINSSLFP